MELVFGDSFVLFVYLSLNHVGKSKFLNQRTFFFLIILGLVVEEIVFFLDKRLEILDQESLCLLVSQISSEDFDYQMEMINQFQLLHTIT